MDQDRPHEAPRSEVMETLDDWRAAWNRYGSPIMTVVAVIAIVYAGWSILASSRQGAYNEAWSALAASTSPASYRSVAAETGNAAVRQNGRLAAADLLLDEAVRAPLSVEEAEEADADADPLAQAESLYRAVLDEAEGDRSGVAGHPLYQLNALEGLAVVAEARRDAGLARERFEAVIAYADEFSGFGRWSARARGHIEALPTLDETPVFAPEPPAEPEANQEQPEATEEEPEPAEAPAPAPEEAAEPAADAAE